MIARITCRMLEEAGYRVSAAHSAAEALARVAECGGRIDLLLSDVVLVGEAGPKVAESVLAVSPDTRVLFVSGYTDGMLTEHGLAPDTPVLLKPFDRQSLLTSVREALETNPV